MKRTYQFVTTGGTHVYRQRRALMRHVRRHPKADLPYTLALRCDGKVCSIGSYVPAPGGVGVKF